MAKDKVRLKFRSFKDLVDYVGEGTNTLDMLEAIRWNGSNPVCWRCGLKSPDHYSRSVSKTKDTFKCRSCSTKFKASSGTLLEGSRLRLPAFFVGLYILYHFRENANEKEMIRELKLSPSCVLCGAWRQRILDTFPPTDVAKHPNPENVGIYVKYEAGGISMQDVLEYVLILSPNGARGQKNIDFEFAGIKRDEKQDFLIVDLNK